MNMIRLPIPNEYIYIDTEKIISLEFDAYDGRLIIGMVDQVNRVIYDGAKRVLDTLLEETNCADGIPNIAKKTRKEPEIGQTSNETSCEDSILCDLIT